MLEEAERRREAELKTKSRTFLVFIGLPVIACSSVRRASRSDIKPRTNPWSSDPLQFNPVEVPRPQAVELNEVRISTLSVPKRCGWKIRSRLQDSPKEGWQMVDKGDISFAMQLLNFMQPPAKKEDGKRSWTVPGGNRQDFSGGRVPAQARRR